MQQMSEVSEVDQGQQLNETPDEAINQVKVTLKWVRYIRTSQEN
jgi:hypothetical protein